MDDYLKKGDHYYYANATAYRSNSINIWNFIDPNRVNKHNAPGEHQVSTTYYQASLYKYAPGELTLEKDSVCNVKSTRWSKIIEKTEYFLERQRLPASVKSSPRVGLENLGIMKRLTTILKAIAIEEDMSIATIWEKGRPREYLGIKV